MKKILIAAAAVLLCATGSLTAYAAEIGSGDDGRAGTSFTLYIEEDNSPTYTITIPDTVSLSKDGTDVAITASGVSNLEDKKISVRFGGTQFTANQLVLQDGTQGNYKIVLYALKDANGRTLVDSRANGNTGDSLVGTELVSFDSDGSDLYRVELLNGTFDPVPVAGVEYYGTLTYNIALV